MASRRNYGHSRGDPRSRMEKPRQDVPHRYPRMADFVRTTVISKVRNTVLPGVRLLSPARQLFDYGLTFVNLSGRDWAGTGTPDTLRSRRRSSVGTQWQLLTSNYVSIRIRTVAQGCPLCL